VRRKSKQMNGDHTQHWADAFQSQVPSVHGKRRCRMHGGALGSGAPRGNKNALKHGRYTREAIAERAHIRELVRQARKLLLHVK
jgi:glucans biosynthesis protein